MLITILQFIIALCFSFYVAKTLDDVCHATFIEWKNREDRADYRKPLKRLPLKIWLAIVAAAVVLSTVPVVLHGFLNLKWVWVFPAVCAIALIVLMVRAKTVLQRQMTFWFAVPFVTATAFCLCSGFFNFLGYFAIGAIILLIASFIKGFFQNRANEDSEDEPDDDEDDDEEATSDDDSDDESDSDDSESEDEDDSEDGSEDDSDSDEDDDPEDDSDDESNSESDEPRKGKNWWKWLLGALVLAAIILGLIFGLKSCSKDKEEPTKTNPKETYSDIVSVGDLTRESLKERFPNWDASLSKNQFSSETKNRVEKSGFSDAVDFPIVNDGTELAQVQEQILHSPVYADMVARGLLEIELSEASMKELAPWLVKFVELNDAAMKDDTKGWTIWLAKDKDGKIILNDNYFDYAARIAIMLDYFKADGVKAKESIVNFRLPISDADEFARTEKSESQENKEAFILNYVRKDTKGIEATIGFNMFDKRFERFELEKPVQKTETTATTTSTPTKKTTPKTPTTEPEPTPSEPTPETTTPKKDTSKDPVNQGSAQRGGGKNKESDGAGTYQPNDPQETTGKAAETTSKPAETTKKSTETTKTSETTKKSEETVHVDDNYQPDPEPATVTSDSHDNKNQNAGTENGEFYMP